MSVLYEALCEACGPVEGFAPAGAHHVTCPDCGGEARRRYSPPVTDCKSYGKNLYGARTPQWKWRAKNEGQERQFRDLAREEGRRTQFGVGRTAGS